MAVVCHIVSDTAEIIHWHRHTPATEGGEDRWLEETQLTGKHSGRGIDLGGKYPLFC